MLDENGLKQLYDDNYQLLYSVGRLFLGADEKQSASVEDAIQEVFLLVWAKRKKLSAHPNLPGFLVEALRKKLLNALGKNKRRGEKHAYSLDAVEADLVSFSDKTFPLPEEAVLDSAREEALKNLLGEDDAALFTQYFIHNLTAKELGEALGLSPDCVRMRAARLRKKVLENQGLFLGIIALLFVRF